jgi:hypothetical protein
MRHLALSVSLVVLWLALAPARDLDAEGPEQVFVTNFPEVQQVAGAVTVAAPVPQTRLERLEALVSPATIAETGSYTEAGTLEAAGFGAVTLSLAGTVQGRLTAAAPVGVVLLPDVPEVVGNFRTHGVAQFALRVEAEATPAGVGGLFQSAPAHLELAFPRYRVLLYNGTPRTSEVTVYAYLKGT